MSDYLQSAIDEALWKLEQVMHQAVDEWLADEKEPIVIDSTAIVLDATPVLLPMPGEKETR